MSEQERILAGLRERGYSGTIPMNPTFLCSECAETVMWVGAEPDDHILSACPECGETGDGILQRVLVVGDPIVLSGR